MNTISSDIKVSIVVPVYNVERWLAECLDSAVHQTLREIEIICVNDGSTDNSGAIIEEYVRKDSRIKAVTQPNGGLSAARNTGMDMATGKYIYFLDSDDMITPDAMEKLYNLAEEKKLEQIIFTAQVFKDPDSDVRQEAVDDEADYCSLDNLPTSVISGSGPEILETLFETDSYYAPVQYRFFNLNFLRSNDLRFPIGMIHEDEYFSPAALLKSERVCVINEKYSIRRIRSNSITTSPTKLMVRFENFLKIEKCLLRDIAAPHMNKNARKVGVSLLLPFWQQVIAMCYASLTPEQQKNILEKNDSAINILLTAMALHIAQKDEEHRTKIHQLKNSPSFRVGRVVTWLPRQVKNIIFKNNENEYRANCRSRVKVAVGNDFVNQKKINR